MPAGTSRYHLYSPELSLLAETVESGAAAKGLQYEYVWFGGQPLAQIETATGSVHWYFNDHLGTPGLTTDTTAVVDWSVEREPHGPGYVIRAGERHQPLAFPGQEDGGHLSYNIFRWYRPQWGRYSQSDPIGIRGGLNLFGYVNANPIRSIDPLGLCDWQSKVKVFDQAYQQYLAAGLPAVYGQQSVGAWGPINGACYIVTLGKKGASCGGLAVAAYIHLKLYNDDCCRVVVKDKWFMPHIWVELECKKCGNQWSKVKEYDPFWDMPAPKGPAPTPPSASLADPNQWKGMGPK